MKKVLLDTNVVLDFALKREPFYDAALAVFAEIAKSKIQGFITASMATDIFYILQRTNGKNFAFETLADLLALIDVLTVYREDVYAAIKSGWDDFEDALQTQVAVQNDLQAIITRNTKDYGKATDIEILSPAELFR
jgi:predicted nucleic acid-binding protein